jgi:benzodiazapine receptor
MGMPDQSVVRRARGNSTVKIHTDLPSRYLQGGINIAALVAALVLNTLSNTLPLGGRTTGQISDSLPSLFVPAGYVFSIWGLIYLALIGFAVYQALPAKQDNPAVRATGWWFALTCAANALWIVFWHYGYYWLTLVVMLILLLSLIVIYRRLAQLAISGAGNWLVKWPFSLYLGWITVATVANVSAVLVWLGWDGGPLSPVTWTVVLAVVAAALALVMAYRHHDVVYAGVIVWALAGIAVKQSGMPVIVAACALCIAAVAAGTLAFRTRQRGAIGGAAP